jgi:hypothetical protein
MPMKIAWSLAVLCLINVKSPDAVAQLPTPSPTATPTTLQNAVVARIAVATVTYATGGTVISRCESGIFDLIGVQPGDTVQVTIQFFADPGLQSITIEPLDGGAVFPPPITVDAGQIIPVPTNIGPISLPISPNGTVAFIFQGSREPGLNQVSIRYGTQELGLEFWVIDPTNAGNNPPALTPTGNQIN